jgi:hypothetical protein
MRKFVEIRNWSPGYINVAPHHVEIRVQCRACDKEVDFDRRSLPPLLHHALITDIEARMKCSCGAKQAKMLFGHYSG